MEKNARLVGVAVLELTRVDILQSRLGFRGGLDRALKGVLPGLRPQVVGVWRKDGDETLDQALFVRPLSGVGNELGPILKGAPGFGLTGFGDIIVVLIIAVRIVVVSVVSVSVSQPQLATGMNDRLLYLGAFHPVMLRQIFLGRVSVRLENLLDGVVFVIVVIVGIRVFIRIGVSKTPVRERSGDLGGVGFNGFIGCNRALGEDVQMVDQLGKFAGLKADKRLELLVGERGEQVVHLHRGGGVERHGLANGFHRVPQLLLFAHGQHHRHDVFAHAAPVVRTGAGGANSARLIPDPHGIAVRAVHMGAVGLTFENQVSHRAVVDVLFPSVVRHLGGEVSDSLLIEFWESHRICASKGWFNTARRLVSPFEEHLRPAWSAVNLRWHWCLCLIVTRQKLPHEYRKYSATRQGWSKGIGGGDALMKLWASSSGCKARPAKGEPARARGRPLARTRGRGTPPRVQLEEASPGECRRRRRHYRLPKPDASTALPAVRCPERP